MKKYILVLFFISFLFIESASAVEVCDVLEDGSVVEVIGDKVCDLEYQPIIVKDKKLKSHWDDYFLLSEYDEVNQKLKVSYSSFINEKPKNLYKIQLSIGDKKCSNELIYKSFYLRTECEFDIAKEAMRGEFKVKIDISSPDSQEVFRDVSLLKTTGYGSDFSWKNFKTEVIRPENATYIILRGSIKDDISEIFEGYKIVGGVFGPTLVYGKYPDSSKLEFKEKYSQYLEYDEKNGELFFEIKEKNHTGLDSVFNMPFFIYDINGEKVIESSMTFQIREPEKKLELDWSSLKADYYVDESTRNIYIKAYLTGVLDEPSSKYIFVTGTHTKFPLNYDSEKKELSSIFTERYNKDTKIRNLGVGYSIRSEKNETVHEGIFSMKVNYSKKTFGVAPERNTSLATEETQVLPKTKIVEPPKETKGGKVAKKITETYTKKYTDTDKRKQKFEQISKILGDYATKKEKLRPLLEEIIKIIDTELVNMK